jgi:predicted MFS family arabinose efflux permease
MDRAAWKTLFADTPLLLAISVTAIQAVGMFAVFSYMALLLKNSLSATPAVISMVFFCFGVTGVIGNVAGARLMDRIGATRVGIVSMTCMLLGLLLWPLGNGSVPLTVALALLWGLGVFAVNSAQQARLVEMAPRLASASVALNSSAIYLGQAVGTFAGGLILATQGDEFLSLLSALPMALAIAVSIIAANLAGRRQAACAACGS